MKCIIEDIPKGLVYLSLPYGHPEPLVRIRRMQAFWKTSADLIAAGVHVISPMSMERTLEYSDLQGDWATWENYCNSLLNACEEIWVMQLEGWDKSIGVKGEIEFAKKHDKPVRFLEFS